MSSCYATIILKQTSFGYFTLYLLMARTCQSSEGLAGSSSGGSEGLWSILPLFLKCSAEPTIKSKNINLLLS